MTFPLGIVASASSGEGEPPAPPDSYFNTIMGHTPALYWRLDESSGTTAADASGNGRTGTYNASAVTLGAPSLLTGDANTAVAMSGTGHRITRTYASWMAGDRTIELLMNPSSVTDAAGATVASMAETSGGGTSTSWHLEIYLGQLYMWVAGGYASGSVPIATSTRYHLAFRVSGTTSTLHVNGVAALSRAAAPSLTADFRVGTRFTDATAPFSGVIDEVSWVPTALTDGQILADAQAAGL